MQPTVCFVSASNQNVFFGELLDALADALGEHGFAVERAVDYFPELRDGLAYAFVPHELIPLLMPDAHPSDRQLRRSVAICTEQPGTPWFDHTVQIARRAGASVDINRLGVAEQRKLGIGATFLQLGYTPLWDRWRGERAATRPSTWRCSLARPRAGSPRSQRRRDIWPVGAPSCTCPRRSSRTWLSQGTSSPEGESGSCSLARRC